MPLPEPMTPDLKRAGREMSHAYARSPRDLFAFLYLERFQFFTVDPRIAGFGAHYGIGRPTGAAPPAFILVGVVVGAPFAIIGLTALGEVGGGPTLGEILFVSRSTPDARDRVSGQKGFDFGTGQFLRTCGWLGRVADGLIALRGKPVRSYANYQ